MNWRFNSTSWPVRIILLLLIASASAESVIYVDADANGMSDGSSWTDAYNYLQDALANASPASKPVEIRVAEGIYKPEWAPPPPPPPPPGGLLQTNWAEQVTAATAIDRRVSFWLINGVTVKGGYAGCSQPDPDAREIKLYETILSGDLDGNDVDVNDLSNLLDEPTRAENCYHVVTCFRTDANAVLDGFTVTGGNSNERYDPNDRGGGMYIIMGNPTVTNCTFRGNSAFGGGGIYNESGSATVTNCIFSENTAGHGCGIFNLEGSNLTVTNCIFSGNYCEGSGGGMYNLGSSPTINNCKFSENTAKYGYGGGMANLEGSSPIVTNCTFTGNSNRNVGGGMYNEYESNPTLTNCTFSENTTKFGGGGICNFGGNPTVINCTFNDNSAISGGGMLNRYNFPRLVDCIFIGNLAYNNGGGMSNWDNSSPTVTTCTFSKNSAGYNGGGMCNREYSSPTVTNCTFTGNSAEDGGGMCNLIDSKPKLTYCTFYGNSAEDGGGMNCNYSVTILTNCTFSGNRADRGNTLACETSFSYSSTVHIANCILRDGSNGIWNNDGSSIIITYSDIRGGWSGPGGNNIDTDPCFVQLGYWANTNDPNIIVEPNDPNAVWIEGDYHLKSQAGRWEPNSQSWVQDDVTSPCIDAGDWMSPIGLEPFPNGGRVNMGSYGGTAEASKSYFGKPVCEIIVAGDVNGDCIVNFLDFRIMALHWLEDNNPSTLPPPPPPPPPPP